MSNKEIKRPTPVLVLTGGLGSGKTTLLSGLLRRGLLADTAVILCEHGEVPLDHHIIRPLSEGPVSLVNGCPCCVVHDDVVNAMQELWARRNIHGELQFGMLVIETSGITNPMTTVTTLLSHPSLTFRYKLAGVICTLDGQTPTNAALATESDSQIALADRFVITKTDLTGHDFTNGLPLHFRDIESVAPVFTAPISEQDAPRLLETRPYGRMFNDPIDTTEPGHLIITRTWQTNLRVRLSALQRALHDNLLENGHQLLRLKGIVNVVDREDPAIVHAVAHHLFPVSYLPKETMGDSPSAITIFARAGAENAVGKLVESLEKTIAGSA